MRTKLSRRVAVAATTLACVLAVSLGAVGQARAAGRAPGLRPAPAALPWLDGAQISPRVFAYPSSFDLRTLGKVSPVKNQGSYGTCWAFAALGSLESNLLPAETWDFSEDNLVWFSGFDGSHTNAAYRIGGNSYMAAAYLTRWSGPFTELQDPYPASSDYSTNHPDPSTMTVQKHVQDVVFLPPRTSYADNDDIKYALTTWGGVYLSMYYGGSYLNGGTDSYYYDGSDHNAKDPSADAPNHGILVVGWDDDYPAGNFSPSKQPPGNGAFLVKNSWGTGFGDGGYFWLSYYDKVAGYDDSSAVFRSSEEATSNYTGIYQHDPLGFVSYIVPDDQTDWFAARYVATASDDVTAAGFWTLGPNATYTLYAGSSLSGLTQVGSGGFAEFGYHTARFDTPYSITQGQAFYVAVRLTVPDFRGAMVPKVALEDKYNGYTSDATAAKNQTFYSDSGSSWSDVVTLGPGFSDADVCLKAYTGGLDGPHTTVAGADTKWHRSPVILTFTASAPAGIAGTDYSLDGGQNWTPVQPDGTGTVPAPSDHSNDGVKTVLYRSTDKNEAVETTRSCTVKIDTQGAVTKAPYAAKVRRYGYVTLRYRVNDRPAEVTSNTVTIRIKTLRGVPKLKLSLGSRPTHKLLSKRFRCSLPRGTYRFWVYAVDPAGNKQSYIGRNILKIT
jgi:C1A family cysteine protease